MAAETTWIFESICSGVTASDTLEPYILDANGSFRDQGNLKPGFRGSLRVTISKIRRVGELQEGKDFRGFGVGRFGGISLIAAELEKLLCALPQSCFIRLKCASFVTAGGESESPHTKCEIVVPLLACYGPKAFFETFAFSVQLQPTKKTTNVALVNYA